MKWFDLAWLKQWWNSEPRRKPKPTKPKVLRNWKLKGVVSPAMPVAEAATKSEARSFYKKMLSVGRKKRLPKPLYVVRLIDA